MSELEEPNEPAAEQQPEGHDLNLEIPEWTMIPLAAVAVALLIAAFGWSALLWSLIPFAVLIAAVTVIDLRELRVPNRLTAPAALVAVPVLLLSSLAEWPELSVVRALIGGAALGGLYLVLALIYPAGMGLGDVKLAPIIGAQLALFGWVPWVRGLFLAHLLGGLVAVVVIVSRRGGLKTGIPHGPFMCAGALAALLLQGWGVG